MKKIALLLLPLSLLFSCNDTPVAPGKNFDTVLQTTTGDTLVKYHSGGFFEAYIISSNSYLNSKWTLSKETDKVIPQVARGRIWEDCSRITNGFDQFPAFEIEEMQTSPLDIYDCDF
ncbi:hypothetical protein KMW28_16505 [Flammeovirga yaeyamensis]|uniref:Lipoprotein n=1 Tax=Flammeovirga yaeyamensis TaxID=367791 RepID=A0AAX1N188_9BACT|nr:hypothetical protein [Flammeovirga yaeyamensis]MBB3698387.1 hypothetical protein [Flammeovirga yaeyamensis]NMF34262.1 hypothetical protein [Flammeovirga yaeyamensis]QWG01245.1 hypothetical protein KMW28_16505 [Flammeovirga yaeyamensis]